MRQQLDYHWQKIPAMTEHARCDFAQFARHHTLPLCVRHEFYTAGSDTGPHQHQDFYALYIVQGGSGIHVINTHPYGIARGDVYLLPPGTTHAYRDYSTLTIDACYFQPQLFSQEELVALRGLTGFWHLLITLAMPDTQTEPQVRDHRLHLSPEHQREIEAMMTEICHEYVATSPEAVLLTRGQFLRMLIYLARWQAGIEKSEQTESTEASSLYKAEIMNVLRICEERFHEPLNVPQLAALTFLSPSRFSELFSREVGVSPAAYIRRLRLERAQTLLRTTALSTTTIAHQVGFRDSAQLARAFRAVFDLAPTEYRARFR